MKPHQLDCFLHDTRTRFDFFVRALWADRSLDKVAPLSEIEMDMVDFAGNGPRLRGILGLRGMGKTTLVTCTLACFRLIRDYNRRVIVVSKSGTEAKKTISLIRNWIEDVWFLNHLSPTNGHRDTTNYFDISGSEVNRQPSVSAFGIEGQLEGNRAHTLIPDDVETKQNTKTREAREELRRLCGEFKNILYPHREHKDGGPIDPVEIPYVGTPKHEETLYQDRIRAGYKFRAYPIAAPAPNEEVIALAPIIADRIAAGTLRVGAPTLPRRFGPQEIAERMAEGYSEFARESMLISNLSATNLYPIRLSDLIVHTVDTHRAPIYMAWGERDQTGPTSLNIPCLGFGDDCLRRPVIIDPMWQPYTHTVAWIDPAGRGADHTGLAIVAYLNGFLWVKHVSSIPGGSSEADIAALSALCRKHHVNSVYVETNADTLGTYCNLFRTVLQRHFLEPGQDAAFPDGWKAGFVNDPAVCHQTGMKEERILAALEPVISNHRMIIAPASLTPDTSRPAEHELQYQLTRLKKEPRCLKEDAMIDALAGATKAINHALGGDPVKNKRRIEAKTMQEEVKRANQLIRSAFKAIGR